MAKSEAVKTIAQIELVEHLLRKNRRSGLYADLWRIGVNLALRISDLLAMRFADIDLVNRQYQTVEQKTGKLRKLRLNHTAVRIMTERFEANPTDVYLFQSDQGRKRDVIKAISPSEVHKSFREVGEELKIALGTHSMRKSRGWAMHSDGVSIEMIAKVLNHSSPAVTMLYLGITEEEVMQTYDDYEL